MAEPEDLIVVLLREMRAELVALRQHMDARFDVMESVQKSFKHALTADTLMSKLITGEFEERIEALEKKVRDLESQK
ncbi:polyhydroxyalkanoate synthesis regulator phasin [Rhodopseudomonas rhenobacensis]|uniref:Polyhydroxyalkanoate synthesis regulator phasin n=1 Tax=Rhodopseudomonas rhenobacensis TaxID=87461 RepID=A0A7W7Z236_9BRAD|nr:hypothetical protein [Rhodopseudomonas rhenobacensis]MBB5046380.1 polyhydroxyalkanoate synthesis regulator phasin [Rhodopseudomonas rhenobacensis]